MVDVGSIVVYRKFVNQYYQQKSLYLDLIKIYTYLGLTLKQN